MNNSNYVHQDTVASKQTELLTGRAVFTNSYAVIPKGVMQDIVVSYLPFWHGTKAWILARPLSGFAETFSQYLVQVEPGGGSEQSETDTNVEAVLFVVSGELELSLTGDTVKLSTLSAGSYVYISPGDAWQIKNNAQNSASFLWIRKSYQAIAGLQTPQSFVTNEHDGFLREMPNSNGNWLTRRFVDDQDLSHDMHVNIVTFKPGACIPFLETHVMEHGMYILQGKGVYRLNNDWVEVEAGDFIWLRAFCPQACYAGGPEDFRYLLYKDVNRHAPLSIPTI